MSDKSKYYTPSIDKFHPNFEFEYKERLRNGLIPYIQERHEYVDRWTKCIFWETPEPHPNLLEQLSRRYHAPKSLHDIASYLKDDAIRVKYLDREDVEQLDWEAMYEEHLWKDGRMIFYKEVQYRGEAHQCLISYNSRSKWIVISITNKESAAFVGEKTGDKVDLSVFGSVYAGKCNNSSQLKQILQWTGVIK